jgi:hypothetical protein
MPLAGNVTGMLEIRAAFKILLGNLNGRDHVKLKHRLEESIELDLK